MLDVFLYIMQIDKYTIKNLKVKCTSSKYCNFLLLGNKWHYNCKSKMSGNAYDYVFTVTLINSRRLYKVLEFKEPDSHWEPLHLLCGCANLAFSTADYSFSSWYFPHKVLQLWTHRASTFKSLYATSHSWPWRQECLYAPVIALLWSKLEMFKHILAIPHIWEESGYFTFKTI